MKKLFFLPLFIVCIGIFVSSSSIVSAWTFDDIYDLANNVDTSLLTADQATTRDRILNHFNEYVQAFEDSGRSFDDYHSFIVWYRSYDGINIQLFNSSTTNWNINSSGYISNGGTSANAQFQISYSNNTWNVSTSGISGQNKSKALCLLEGASTTILNTSGLIAQNVYNSIVTTNVNVPSNASVPYLFTQGVVGLHYDITQVHYKLVLKGASGTQDTFNQDLGAVFSETGNGHSVNLQLTTLNTLQGTNNYYIDMYYNGDIIYTSDTFSISYSVGGSSGGSTSGDSNNNSVNLTVTNQKLDDINNSIKSGDLAIISSINDLESGERSRDNFWRNTYDDLFKLSSGDVDDIYNGIKSQFNSGDFVIDYYKPIQEVFDRDPDDFVISWGAINLNLTAFNGASLVSGEVIPSGDINFSKLCRDNETLGYIKSILNVVVGFSFLFLLIFEYYKVLLYCLGVGSQLIGEAASYEEQTVDIDSEVAHVTTLPNGQTRASITHSFGRTTRRRH